ncbi:hypothetical protein HJG60_011812 [Phyllostomus discolor]|uniref:Uncharacterized protein n=1 Tax=Phyllostomus discolor TaxID=89673 RepID=A0A834DYC3_9CHIR|nr:hypothetical protein HJG60_011812 [Phyllostomus discolor]
MPRLFRAGRSPPLPPPRDDHCARERKLGCARALPWKQLTRNDRTEAVAAPAIRPVGGLESEQRGPSSEGSRQASAVKARGLPGPGASQPQDSPVRPRPPGAAERKVIFGDPALRGLTPSLLVRTPCSVGWPLGQNSFAPRALASPAEKWEPLMPTLWETT